MENKYPKVDDGTVYPEITKFIRGNGYAFNLKNVPTVAQVEKLAGQKFFKIADCVLNIAENFPKAKRRSFINGTNWSGKLVNYIPLKSHVNLWQRDQKEWLYIIAYNGRVVKIGMTSSGFASRFGSYNTGTKLAMIKGSCATTNFVLTQVNYLSIMNRVKVEIYAYEIPENWTTFNIFGKKQKVLNKVAHKYESTLIDLYKQKFNFIPPLCGSYGPTE